MQRRLQRNGKNRNLRIINVSDKEIEAIQATHIVYKIIQDGEVFGYFKTCKKSGRKKDFQDVKRILAYEHLAHLFSLSGYITHSEYCILKTESKELFGTFQAPAKEENIWSIPSIERARMITPVFQMALSKMWLFDVVCHELDHSLNNYYPVINSQGFFYTVNMFDNGSVGTFGTTITICDKTYYGIDPLFSDEGHFCFPYQDKALIECIRRIRFYRILSVLFSSVSLLKILCTWIRIVRIRKVIKHDLSSEYLIMLEQQQWSQQTIDDELSGKYGKTYLYSLVHDWGGDGISPDHIIEADRREQHNKE